MRHSLFTLILLAAIPAQAAEPIRIAVAANLLPVMEQIAGDYQRQTGVEVQLAGGSSGAFFEQIRRGAPFDLFYSADAERPDQLATSGLGSGAQTYACGRLALWTPKAEPRLDALPAGKIAIAQPDTAPYGRAALQAIERSGQLALLRPHLVYAQDIGQAYQFVHSGNAPSGLVALSQLTAARVPQRQFALVEARLYEPLVQKRVLLARDERKPAAEAFLRFFDAQRDTLHAAGYGLPGETGCAAD